MESYCHFIAGWGAGTLGIAVGHPMDTIKTHQQTSNLKLSAREAVSIIVKKDGIRGLYKGMLFPLLGAGSLNSMYFGVYDACLKFFQFSLRGHEKILPSNTGWIQDLFVAGSIAGSLQAVVTCPSELIKIRMQLGKGDFQNEKNVNFIKKSAIYKTALDVYKQSGVRGFFIGFLPTMWRDGLGGGIYILSYQITRHYMYGKLNLNPEIIETLVAGGIAGFMSWVPVIPFDTLKSRMQADNFQKPMYRGMIHCSTDLFKKTSYSGFFKGFLMITIRSVPVNISIMYGFESTLWFCKNLNQSN